MGGKMINICFSSDNNYAKHLAVTLASILANTKNPIHVYVLDGGICDENKTKILDLKNKFDFEIDFLNIDTELFKTLPKGKQNHVTLATYYRLILAKICSDVDKMLYLDVDIIVKTDLKELFDTDLKDNYFAAVYDSNEKFHAKRLQISKYCNAGVLLLNLKKWRDENVTKKLFDWANQNSEKIVLHDQDILNCALQDGILYINKLYNVQIDKTSKEFVKSLPDAKIIHYIGKHKPWHSDNKQFAKGEYFKYLKLTSWKNTIYKYHLCYLLKLPFLISQDIARFIFKIEKQGGNKVLQICGLKFNIR